MVIARIGRLHREWVLLKSSGGKQNTVRNIEGEHQEGKRAEKVIKRKAKRKRKSEEYNRYEEVERKWGCWLREFQ